MLGDDWQNLSVTNGTIEHKGWIIHCVTLKERRYYHVVCEPPKGKTARSTRAIRDTLVEQARGLWLSGKYATVQLAYHDGNNKSVVYFRHAKGAIMPIDKAEKAA